MSDNVTGTVMDQISAYMEQIITKMDEQKTQVATLVSRANEQETQMATLLSRANEQQSRANEQETQMTTLLSRANDQQSRANEQQSRANEQETQMTTLLSRANEQQSRANEQETQMTTLLSRANEQQSRANEQETQMTTLLSRANEQQSRANEQETRMTTLLSRANEQETQMATLLSRANEQETRMLTLLSRANGQGALISGMKSQLVDLKKKIDKTNFYLRPLTRPEIQNCNLVEDSENLYNNSKNGVFTWFTFSPTLSVGNTSPRVHLIGSAHVTLRYCAFINDCRGKFFQFVTLPDSVLKRGVTSVFFVNNIKEINNPSRPEQDICVIEVRDIPSNLVNVSRYSSPPQGMFHFKNLDVAGKSVGRYVSSQGGAVTVEVGKDGLGYIEFLLQVGEPGDSGTLLHMEDPVTEAFLPIAVFRGAGGLPHQQRRGVATVIPPPEKFWKYSVANASDIVSAYPRVTVSGKIGSEESHICVVAENWVSLNYHGCPISGVFVETECPSQYIGDLEIACMNQEWIKLDSNKENGHSTNIMHK